MHIDQRRPSRLARMRRALGGLWARPERPGPEAKASASGPLIAIEGLGAPAWMPRDYAAFAREGMMQNAVVYRSVRMIAEAAASVPLLLYAGDEEIEAPATAIDIHNTASRWNKALLDNSARPSGALVYSSGAHLTGEQFERLKAELETSFQGAGNAGRPLLLEGGLDWRAMSLSPRDLDFINAKHAAAREIALALGVPPMLLGIPGDNTYANYQEANRTFWRQTVLPLVNRTARSLSAWLAPAWGEPIALKPDLDAIEALSAEREALWARLERASFLTADEKRAAVGYGSAESGDIAQKGYRPDQPRVPTGQSDGGQWTSGGGDGDLPRVAQGRLRGRPPFRGKPPSAAPGPTIRNKDLAGKNHPDTGIPLDKEGFPDFS